MAAEPLSIGYKNTTGLAIDSGAGVIGHLSLNGCKDVTITGRFSGDIDVVGCANVVIRDLHYVGDGTQDALMIRRSNDVRVIAPVIMYPRCGIKLITSRRVEIVGASVGGMRIDGLDIDACQDVTVTDSGFIGSLLLGTQHPDGVQIWTAEGEELTARIAIQRNVFQGDIQGSSCFGKPRGAEDVLIEANRYNLSRPNAITLNNVVRGVVRGNEIRTIPGSKYQAKMNLCTGTESHGNIVAAGAGKKAVSA